MSSFNLLVHLDMFDDDVNTNSPSRSNVRWNRDMQGIDISDPKSTQITLAAGGTVTLFSGTESTSEDGTTTYDIALKSGSSNTYIISHNSGTAPAFKTARTSGADATTEVTVTKNAKLLTFTSTGGTAFDLVSNGVIVGDKVRIGDGFNTVNRGEFTVLAVTATSFTIENETGTAESAVTLGADFATNVNIYSAAGIMVGDKIDITAGFSPVTYGTYDITDVSHDYIEFYSTESLPTETGIASSSFLIYRDAKQFLYIESNKKIGITINGASTAQQLEPFTVGTVQKPGIFMTSSSVKSVTVENLSIETATIFYICAE